MSKALVTGGAGFIGSHLVDLLVAEGKDVVIVDNFSTGQRENVNPKAKVYELDIRSAQLAEIFETEKPDVVFHLAAQISVRNSVENPLEDADVNVMGSLNVIKCSADQKVSKLIFASSGGAIYGEAETVPTAEGYLEQPLSPYGVAKLAIEKYLFSLKPVTGLNYTALRLGNVYGPRQNSKGEAGVVAIMIDQILHDQQTHINGDGLQTRDYVYVKDVARAFVLAQQDAKSDKFNVACGQETNVNQVFDTIVDKMGRAINREYAPAKAGEQMRSCLDYSRIKEELNWQPEYDFDKGIAETVQHFSDEFAKKNK